MDKTIQDLIKMYPNNMELGEAVRKIFGEVSPSDDFLIHQLKLLNGSILTYDDKGECIHRTDGISIDITRNLKESLEDGIYPVMAIKRTSDGHIFTLGDKVRFPGVGKVEITEIFPTGYILHKDISRYVTTIQ